MHGNFIALTPREYNTNTWPAILLKLVYGYNITPQGKLGVSPYKMLFGRLPPVRTNYIQEEAQLWAEAPINYVNCLQQTLAYYHNNASYLLNLHQKNMKKQYDLHRPKFKPISIGDCVYIGLKFSHRKIKISRTYRGPHKVDWVQVNPRI